jgi:hypothetical protein
MVLALRPHGDSRRPRDRDRPAELRPGGLALRVERGRLSTRSGNRKGYVEKSIHFST